MMAVFYTLFLSYIIKTHYIKDARRRLKRAEIYYVINYMSIYAHTQ